MMRKFTKVKIRNPSVKMKLDTGSYITIINKNKTTWKYVSKYVN